MRMLTSAIAALGLLCSLTGVRAGDPIQFSTDKTKPTPGETRPADTDVFKSWKKTKGPGTSPLNSLTPFITPGRSADPRAEKRFKNERDEKKNWMLLEPGELQKREEEEENEFGGKGIAIDNLNDDKGGNYLFHNVTQSKSDQPRQNPQRPANDTDDQPKKDTRSLSVFGSRDNEGQGAHTAKELNLKGLIDPSQVNPAHLNKNEASLFQFLKDNSLPPPDRDQQARRETFRDFINGPQPNGAPSGISDPINFRTDLTQERLNPTMPARPAFELPSGVKGAEGFAAKPTLGGGFTPGRAQALPDMIPAPRQPMGSHLPSPLLMRNEPKSPPPLFGREVPRRGGI